MTPDSALYILRFLRDATAMLLWGGYVYLSVLVPFALRQKTVRQLALARALAIGVLVFVTVGFVPVETAFIVNGWSSALDWPVTREVLLHTNVGTDRLVQLAIVVILLATLKAPLRLRPSLTACVSGLLLLSLAFSGHAVMQDGVIGYLHRANDAIHVLSAGAWFGALVPLSLILISLGNRESGPQAAVALGRFSTVGHFAVGLAIASGICNGFLVMGGWPAHWTRPYQVLLLAKIAVVLAMVLTAVINRYRFVPDLRKDRARAIRSLRKGAAVEITLGLVAIGLVAVFGMMDPG